MLNWVMIDYNEVKSLSFPFFYLHFPIKLYKQYSFYTKVFVPRLSLFSI